MALFAIDVEEAHGTGLELRILDAELGQSFLDETAHFSHLGDTREVALHVGHEAGNACLAEGFGHHLQGDGLSCSGGTGNESVAVGHFTVDTQRTVGAVGYIQPAFFV